MWVCKTVQTVKLKVNLSLLYKPRKSFVNSFYRKVKKDQFQKLKNDVLEMEP